MTKQLQIGFVFSSVALSFRFFDARFIDPSLLNYIHFISVLILIAVSIPYFFPSNKGFTLPVQLIVISILVSVFMAYFSWGQSFTHSIIQTYPYLTWIFFFYLLHIRIPVRTIENIVIIYCFIYIVLYLYQFTHSSSIVFGKSLRGDEFTEDRGGVARIIFPGAGIFLLGIFIAANRLTTEAENKLLWLFVVLMGIVVPILQVTREFIAGVCGLYAIHFLRYLDWTKKVIVIITFTCMLFWINYTFPNIAKGLNESIQHDLNLGSNYIRVLAAEYYLFDFSPDTASKILGNGVPYQSSSIYGLFMDNIEEEYGYFISDVGIIGMYSMFGVLSVVGYFFIWYKSFTVAVPEQYQYLKYYLWYLLLTSLTWYSVYHYHYVIATVLALYVFQRIYEKENSIEDE